MQGNFFFAIFGRQCLYFSNKCLNQWESFRANFQFWRQVFALSLAVWAEITSLDSFEDILELF